MTAPTLATRVIRRAKTDTTTPTGPALAPSAGIPDIWSTLSEPGSVKFLKGVLFGPPKTGKTVGALAGTGKKLLILTEPEGDLSVTGRKDVQVIRPQNWRDINKVITSLHTDRKDTYPTVVFDSVTFMIELIGGKEIAQTFIDNKDVRRAYGKTGAAVNQLIHDAVALQMNVFFTAQMRAEQPENEDVPLNPEDGKYPLTVGVTPMVYQVLVPAVSFIGRTYKKTGYVAKTKGAAPTKVVEYWVSFEDYGKSPAGSRLPVPEQVQNFNPDTLLKEA